MHPTRAYSSQRAPPIPPAELPVTRTTLGADVVIAYETWLPSRRLGVGDATPVRLNLRGQPAMLSLTDNGNGFPGKVPNHINSLFVPVIRTAPKLLIWGQV